MMVSTTRCFANRTAARRRNSRPGARAIPVLSRFLPGFAVFCLAAWLAFAGSARAAETSAIRQAEIKATPQGYALDATADIALNRTLVDALERGIHLHFLLELEISRPRGWWWFDESIAEPVRKSHLYYHLLLRRYVVENGYTTRTVNSLAEALTLLGQVEDWQMLERGTLKAGQHYQARLRFRLDTSQLPKPLSIAVVSGDKWELATSWYAWSFDAPALPPAP